MARARTIKPGFFANDDLADLRPLVRLLFAGLWCWADKEGRLLDRPKKIKADILPYDNLDVDTALAQLAAAGFIVRYEAESQRCIQVLNWLRHQHPHPREDSSTLPLPPGMHEASMADAASMDDPEQGHQVPEKAGTGPSGTSSSSSSSSSGTSSSSSSGSVAADAAAAAPGVHAARTLVDEFYKAIGVETSGLTRSIRKRELIIAGQLIEAGARSGEAGRFVAWCLAAPYRPVPSNLRVYEARRAQFLAGLEPITASSAAVEDQAEAAPPSVTVPCPSCGGEVDDQGVGHVAKRVDRDGYPFVRCELVESNAAVLLGGQVNGARAGPPGHTA